MRSHCRADIPLEEALARLNALLPLKARQQQLSPALQAVHRKILLSFACVGQPPSRHELREVIGATDIDVGLRELGALDLVVLDENRNAPVGAYPLTCEVTPHRISINGHNLYAMCALDAVSVAPMFDTEVRIDSSCHVSQTPVCIRMQGDEYDITASDMDAIVGIYWQLPKAVAAHSICTQMVFLKDWATARRWQANQANAITLFDLTSAAEFGAAFFKPLVQS